MINLVGKAVDFAAEKHKGQKYGELEFIYHPAEVARIIETIYDDYDLVAAAWLHDTMEDCGITYEQLKEEFNEEIANLVKEVTKAGYNEFPNLHSQKGVILKFADRLSNLSNIDNWSDERKQAYILKSKFWK